ncbi:MAG TPA: hypothetical protein VH500_09080 [Nitrososphaeraceae archaeon]|jgi:hypothetical protein
MYQNKYKNVALASVISVAAIVLLGISVLGNIAMADDGSRPDSGTQGQEHESAMKCNDGSLCLLVAPQVVHPLGFGANLHQDNRQDCDHDSSCAQVNQQNHNGRNLLAGGFHFDD